MPFWKRVTDTAACAALVLALAGCGVPGDGRMSVTGLEAATGSGKVMLRPSLELALTPSVYEALHNGVPLVLLLEARLQRERRWLWADTLVLEQRRFRLTYHSLGDQYLLQREDEAAPRAFPSREALLTVLESPEPWTLAVPAGANGTLYAGVRARLDLNALPAPLRLAALFNPAWRVGSPWRRETLPR